MEKIKVLLITSMPWREDNNIGNSYSNIFKGIDNLEFSHIYCRSGLPENSFAKRYFQITEKSLLKNLFNSSNKTGKSFSIDSSFNRFEENKSNIYNKMRILRWQIFFLARDIIWYLGKWKSEELNNFVDDFKPDIIFGTLTYMPNVNKLMVYLKKRLNIPMITYSWDDVYSLKQFSISPIFWIRKFYQRKEIRKCVQNCEFMYTISEQMKIEYSKYFNIKCKMLYKAYDFSVEPKLLKEINSPLKLVFMGNIGAGRWRTLVEISKVIEKLNKSSQKMVLYIYTLSPKSKKMIKLLSRRGSSYLMESVPNEKVMDVQKNADILIHVEPTKLSERLFYRLSFSTKIVDYLYNARCILGVGGHTATLDYIKENDAGIVVYNLKNLKKVLENIIVSPSQIIEYSKKSWECGVKNHQKENIKNKIVKDFWSFI